MTKRGNLFIISAPSGGGKTTLSNMLLRTFDGIVYSVSHTTRPPRTGESDGIHYNFVDKNTFLQMKDNGEFLEHAVVHDNYYGTSRIGIENKLAAGKDVLLDIDIQGAMQLKFKVDYGVYIFIMPPSMSVLEKRLEARKDTEDIELRLNNAIKEIQYAQKYDYIVVNDDLDKAFYELSSIYVAEGCRNRVLSDIGAEFVRR